ncbi:MAG: hypothetical protein JWQ03_2022, partial [Variovorax sp.]|nr:hypothetical protein [Variovorax sp.]
FSLLSVCAAAQVEAAPIFQVAAVGTAGNINNYPAAEDPTKIRDATPGTKYLNFAKTNTGIIETFSSAQTVNGLIFATAGDAAPRDPLTFSLYGTNSTLITGSEAAGANIDLGTFTLIAANQPIAGFTIDPGRNTTVANQLVTNANAYSTYAVIFPTIRDAAAANSMQIGDITFTNGGTAIAGQATNPVVGGQTIAVPEPATLGLLSVGIIAGLARRRRA